MDNNLNKIWTVIDIINWGTDYFKLKKIESPRLCIELLLCHVLDFERIDIYLQHDKPLTKPELDLLRTYVKRKADREPLQYITEKSQFYGLEFEVNKNVLIPRPETEILVVEAIKIITQYKNPVILDIGTGTGNIAISIANNSKGITVLGIDNSSDSIQLAIRNAEKLKIENVKFRQIDIFNFETDEKFDIIVSNPPYINYKEYQQLQPEVLNYEPAEALTDYKDGLTYYKRFADIFPSFLSKGGKFLLEIGFEQSEFIGEIFHKAGFKFEFVEDFNKIKRIIIGEFQ